MSYVYENEDILRSAPTKKVFSDYCNSFTEAALYIAESVERDFNDMMFNIGVHELAVYESTGMQIVYEAEEKKSLINKAVELFQKIWSSIKGFFEDALQKITDMIKESNKKIAGKIDLSKINFKDKDGNEKTFGKVHCFDNDAASRGINRAKDAKEFMTKVSDEIDKCANDDGTADKDALAQTEKELRDKLIKTVSGFDAEDVKSACKKIKEEALGKKVVVDEKFINDNFKLMKNIVIEKSVIDKIKDGYKSARTEIDTAIKKAKELKAGKESVYPTKIRILKDISTASNSVRGAYIDIYKKMYSDYRGVLVRLCIETEKAKIKSNKESFDASTVSGQLDLLESVLNF